LTKGAFAAEIVFNVLLTVVLFSLFVLAFFFVFAAKVERNVVRTSVQDVVTEFSNEIKFVLDEEQAKSVSAALANVRIPDMAAADDEVKNNNSALTKKATKVLGLSALGIVIVVVIAYVSLRGSVAMKTPHLNVAGRGYPNMTKVLLVTTFGFVAVILTEFAFLFIVANRYKPLDANKVKCTVIDTLLQFSETKI
jgi:hypothetical protein